MAYGRSRLTAHMQAGDPFLGGIIKGIGKGLGVIGKIAPGPIGTIARTVGGALAPVSRAPRQRALPFPGPMVNLGTSLPGLGLGGPQQRVSFGRRQPGIPGVRRRRRINPSNSRALRRAVSRISAWDRQRKSVEKALRKVAPKPARRARADLPRGHRHVR